MADLHKLQEIGITGIIFELTPWTQVLLEKPAVAQLLKNFPIFYRTRSFITMFTTARHWFLSSPYYPILFL
jgi:hypothetical protein